MSKATTLQGKLEQSGQRLDIFRDHQQGELLLTQNAFVNERPFIHPIHGPDGQGILTEDSPSHHPWQHGLYVGLHEVNGIGFWKERAEDGLFRPKPLEGPNLHANKAQWTVKTDWLSPEQNHMITETQQWTLTDYGELYELDVDWTLKAEVDISFGEIFVGGLFLRMPYRKEAGGIARNSEGEENAAAEGQRARWVAVSMPIEGRDDWATITMMDHHTNPEHPVPWRVDHELGVAPSRCIAGAWELKQGQSQLAKHRLLIACGPAEIGKIESSWSSFNQR